MLVLVFTTVGLASVEVSGSATSRVTDLSANPNAVNDVHTFDNTTPATVLVPTTTSSAAAMTNGSASGSVTASMGQFKGFATSTYSNTGLNEYAETDVRASASDMLTITSPSLAPHTPVMIGFSLSVSGTLTSPDVIAGGAYESFATASLDVLEFGGLHTLYLNYDSMHATNVLTGTFSGYVGELVELDQSMELTTYVSGYYLFTHPDVATVDFSHTIQFFGDPATPDVFLVSESGHEYSSRAPSVPEPSALVIWSVFGALGITIGRFRRRKAAVRV